MACVLKYPPSSTWTLKRLSTQPTRHGSDSDASTATPIGRLRVPASKKVRKQDTKLLLIAVFAAARPASATAAGFYHS